MKNDIHTERHARNDYNDIARHGYPTMAEMEARLKEEKSRLAAQYDEQAAKAALYCDAMNAPTPKTQLMALMDVVVSRAEMVRERVARLNAVLFGDCEAAFEPVPQGVPNVQAGLERAITSIELTLNVLERMGGRL